MSLVSYPAEGLDEDLVHGDADLDLGRLEEELHSAIATELENASDEKAPGRNDADSEQGIPEDEITRLAEVFEEAEAEKARTERSSRNRKSASREMVDGIDDDHDHEVLVATEQTGLLRTLSKPVESLSPTMRIIVNIIAITLALWVPIIWLIALNGGFAWQNVSMTDPVGAPISGFVENEPVTP